MNKMKTLVNKFTQSGHLQYIKNYMENLPKNKTKNNVKKAIIKGAFVYKYQEL